ncbi:MAG: AAA family ATPase, partial [Spirochaetaceae bacterium]|nr:AAA family ATPase [Spirochaetaceae bacterium]
MADQLIHKDEGFIRILPAWAQEMANKYRSKTANLYILHGNIRDFLPHRKNEDEFTFTRIQEYISDIIFGNRDIIVFYDRSSGVTFCLGEMALEYRRVMGERYPDAGEALFSAEPERSFFYLEKYFLLNSVRGRKGSCRMVLIIDYAETIAPAGELARLSEEDRYRLVTLNRWSNDPAFTEGDISIILLTENLADISPRLAGAPSVVRVQVPFPDEGIRARFLRFKEREGALLLERGLNAERVAAVTSGLNLMNLERLVSESAAEKKILSLDYLRLRKKETIENEAAGLLEFMDTLHDLSYVSGNEFVKKRFRDAARAIKLGRLDVLPMGYLISGPVGTGKSFMVSAFAGEIGIPMVKFRNFRSKWQGVTESNLERVLNILKSMAPVAVMIDEADAFLGDRDQEGDSGTSNRVFAQIASFMGNTEYRGRIIWFLITCRPDLIPIDLKRQGRAEEHLALFYPDTEAEREALFNTLVRKLELSMRKFSVSEMFRKFKYEFSGADLEAVLIRAKLRAAMANRIFVDREDMEQALEDFMPPAYPHEIELQNLVAVLECTSREMIPRRFRNLDRSKLIRDIQEYKT